MSPIDRIFKQVEEMVEKYVLMSPAEIDNFLKRLREILNENILHMGAVHWTDKNFLSYSGIDANELQKEIQSKLLRILGGEIERKGLILNEVKEEIHKGESGSYSVVLNIANLYVVKP